MALRPLLRFVPSSIDAARTGTTASTVGAARVKLALAITVCCAVVKRASAVTVSRGERRSSLRPLWVRRSLTLSVVSAPRYVFAVAIRIGLKR